MPKSLPTDYQSFIHLSRYARWLPEKNRREYWDETVKRYFDYFEWHLKDQHDFSLTKSLRDRLESAVLDLEVMPSMRALMTAGEALKRDQIAGYNCCYVAIDHVKSFSEIMYILMNGTGVGFSVERQFVSLLNTISEDMYETDTTIIVRDSKLGWAKAFKELLSLLYSGQVPKWDLSLLRPAGAPLKVFGGRASGPEPLDELFKFTVKIFQNAKGRKLQSIECHDIVCKVAEIVVVGGVRRSALISLSNLSDDRMRGAKSGQWWESNPQRALANNSTCYTEKPDIGIFMDEWKSLYDSKSGERGIFNRDAAKKQVQKYDRRDPNYEFGSNPCNEILLRSRQFCNLSEVVIREEDTIETLKNKVELATILGTFQSTLTNFKFIGSEYKHNCEEERLLGVSLTGIMDNKIMSTPGKDLKDTLKLLKEHSIKVNKKWSDMLKINQSTAVTCVKPSGCQVKQTMVLSSEGILSLEEIGGGSKKQWEDINLSIQQHDGKVTKSTKFYTNGKAKTIKIKTKTGMTLEATPNHKFQLLENGKLVWKRMDQLSIGDLMPYKVGGYSKETNHPLEDVEAPYPNTKSILMPKTLNTDLAWLMGLYQGDGSNHKKGIRIAGCIKDIEFLEKAKKITKDQFGIDAIIYTRTKCENNADLYLNSTHLLAWLKCNGLMKNKSTEIFIPEAIRRSSKKSILSFFEGYWEADGGAVNNSGKSYVTTSLVMAQQSLTVLRSIGVDCTVRNMPPTESSWGTNMRYWIQEKKGRSSANLNKTHFYSPLYTSLNKAGLDHLSPDVIVSIENSENETYDIEVPHRNMYMANSYISHNTVSQLVDAASGIHARHAPTYIRTVRADNKDPLCQLMKEGGFYWEPCVIRPDHTSVFSFPMTSPKKSISRAELTAIQQLEIWLEYQNHWCEHKPSVTISVKEHEWLEVGAFVYKHFDDISGISFLPFSDHTYKQAPYTDATAGEVLALKNKLPTKFDWSKLSEYEKVDNTIGSQELACTGNACEIVDLTKKSS